MIESVRCALTSFCIDNTFEFAFSQAQNVPFDESVCASCKENLCGLYNTRWTCPPANGSLDENRNRLSSFENILLFSTAQPPVDFLDAEAVRQSRNSHLQTEKQAESFFDGIPHRLFSAGACDVCAECTYPDAPCRFPSLARTACEAVGIHVFRLAEKLGMHISDEQHRLIWFSLIFY